MVAFTVDNEFKLLFYAVTFYIAFKALGEYVTFDEADELLDIDVEILFDFIFVVEIVSITLGA